MLTRMLKLLGLGATQARPNTAKKASWKPQLESLEQRDVPVRADQGHNYWQYFQ
jgi:hypothetical protein